MDRMIYTSMSGAKATMQRQDTLANNLANVSTPGFRAELQAFRAVPVQGSGASTRVYTLETTTGYDASAGTLVTRSGLAVLGDGGPIQIPRDTAVSIGGDGTVSAKSADGKITAVG